MITLYEVIEMDNDCGPFRSYELETRGSSLDELINNAFVFEVNQDGGTVKEYPLNDASNKLYDRCYKIIKNEFFYNVYKPM